MKSEQAQSTEAAPTPSTRALARPTSMPSWPAWSTDSVLTVGGTGIGGLATRSWLRLPSRGAPAGRPHQGKPPRCPPAPAQRKNGEREVGGVPLRVHRTGGARWLRSLPRKPGKAPGDIQ